MMHLDEFMHKAKASVKDFEEKWGGGIRSDGSDNYPEWMEEEDWWEQFIIHMSNESDYL